MNSPFKYRAFISYSHSDEKWARWLHRRLETYRLPRNLVGRETAFGPVPARFTPVFRDRDELATATSLGATLVAALEQSACQIVICSPSAVGGDSCTSRAFLPDGVFGTYEVYWKISPMSLRAGRCKMMSVSTPSPMVTGSSPQPTPPAADTSAVPSARVLNELFTASS